MCTRLTVLLTVLSFGLQFSSFSGFTITAKPSLTTTTFNNVETSSALVTSLISPSYDLDVGNLTSTTKATTTTTFAEKETVTSTKTKTSTTLTSTTSKAAEESEKSSGLVLAKMPTSTTQATEVTTITSTSATTSETKLTTTTVVEGQELKIMPEFKTRDYKQIKCIYSMSKKIISCNNGQVECESTFFNFTAIDVQMFREFAIGFVPNQETVSIHELVKFYLYPRLARDHYGNFTTQLGDTFYRTSIYFANEYFDDGLRVSDTECWARVVDFFRRYDSHTRITIKSTYGNVDKIFTFGKLTILD